MGKYGYCVSILQKALTSFGKGVILINKTRERGERELKTLLQIVCERDNANRA